MQTPAPIAADLRQLRCFVAVAEEGQISAAARRLHTAQPAVTQTIRGLEAAVGATLFERHSRGMRLTAAGQRFLPAVREIFVAHQRALTALREVAPERLHLDVGAIALLPEFAELMAAFDRAYPEIRVRRRPQSMSADFSSIADGVVDLGLVLPDYSAPGLHGLTIAHTIPHVYDRRDSALMSLDRVCFEDLDGRVWPSPSPGTHDVFADLFYLTRWRDGQRPSVSAEAPDSPDEVWGLVAAGDIITISPNMPVTFGAGVIACRPVIDIEPFALRLLWREDNANPALAALVGFARARLGAYASVNG